MRGHMMAAEQMVTISAVGDNFRCTDDEISVNCVAFKERQFAALQELKSAKTIISLLQEDLKYNLPVPLSDKVTPMMSESTNEPNLSCAKWSAVTHKNKQVSLPHNVNPAIRKYTLPTVNRFAPLATTHVSKLAPESKQPHLQQSSEKTIWQPYQPTKIPTIVNGTTSSVTVKKHSKTRSIPLPKPWQPRNNPGHKINIIGDSHLKGVAFRLTQLFNIQFEVTSLIKPGAKMKQVLPSNEREQLN